MDAPPLLWLALGGVLLLLALLGIDTDGLLLIGGVAGLAVAVIAAATTMAPWLQVLLFCGLVGAGYGWLRRWARHQGERAIPPAARAEHAEVIDAFDAGGEGRVRWQGQSWAALNLEPSLPLTAGSQVVVMGREGTRLQVLPR
ncbi:MAG TPA: NfeD family protein [Cyanobium sp.]|nr:NfeD family protein [Cyanobium sp.]